MLKSVRRVDFIPGVSTKIPDSFTAIARPDAPTLVAVHGISRNAAEIATRFARHPQFRDVNIVAPLFERPKFGKYQQLLARRSRETPADEALFALLEALKLGVNPGRGKFMLFGFSGGAQMAHRLAILYPERVSSLCAVSAGWYLMPDAELAYPYGIGSGCPKPVELGAFLTVPTTIMIGNRDTGVDATVRQEPVIVTTQGKNRLRRSRTWVKAINDLAAAQGKAPIANLITLENGTHDFGQCARETPLLDHAATALLL